MKVDRILIDIFDWVRRLVWSREEKSTTKPYKRLESWRGTLGVLHRVERDTPRAVATFIFSPYRHNGYRIPNPQDIHFCLDFLSKPKRATKTPITDTHRITILIASHWPDERGEYDSSLLYVGDWDFQGSSPYRDRWAIAIIYDVARLVKDRPWQTINWRWELECSAKQMMGADYPR